MDTGKRAVIYIASGQQYIDEARVSARSINGQYPCILCTPDVSEAEGFDSVLNLTYRQFDYWYLDEVNYLNFVFDRLINYDRLLLLDTDTYVCGVLTDFFTVLDRFDIAGTHAIARETQNIRDDIPASFPELHVGAISFNRSDTVAKLFGLWFELYRSNPKFYKNNDQGPLREALWKSNDVRPGILPGEFCFRFRWGGLIGREVRVLHGREYGKSSYEEIAEEVNSGKGPRVYKRRELA